MANWQETRLRIVHGLMKWSKVPEGTIIECYPWYVRWTRFILFPLQCLWFRQSYIRYDALNQTYYIEGVTLRSSFIYGLKHAKRVTITYESNFSVTYEGKHFQ